MGLVILCLFVQGIDLYFFIYHFEKLKFVTVNILYEFKFLTKKKKNNYFFPNISPKWGYIYNVN